MNPEAGTLSIVLFLAGVVFLAIAVFLVRLAARSKNTLKKLLALLPEQTEGQDLERCLAQSFKDFGLTRKNGELLYAGFLELTDRLSIAATVYDPVTDLIEYNAAFAQLAGIRDREGSRVRALELPLFGDLFHAAPVKDQTMEMGSLKLKVHVRASPELVMAVFEDIARQERTESDRRYFSNTLWHEIKTPVTIMKGFSNILLEELRDPFLLKATTTIDKQVARIESLIGSLRTLADRREDGKSLCRARDIADIIPRLVESWQEEADKRRLTVTIESGGIDQTEVTLRFTRGDFFVLASNLISNAVKFSREGGQIRIKTGLTQHDLVLQITDPGPGIPAQLQAILYSPLGYEFLKGEGNQGMGLFLVKEAVERGGGRIAFKSGAEGTSYRITLPFQDN